VETRLNRWIARQNRFYNLLFLYALIANALRVINPDPSSAIAKFIAYTGILSVGMLWFFLAAWVTRGAIALYSSDSTYVAVTPPWKIVGQVIISYVLAIFLFAILYFDISPDERVFGRRLSFPSALYFSVVAITTTGFGDIAPCPECDGTKLLIASELLFGFFYTVLFFSILAGLAGRSKKASRSAPPSVSD